MKKFFLPVRKTFLSRPGLCRNAILSLLLTVLFFAGSSRQASAQTTLSAGDIAIIGYNADDQSSNDNFAFILLTNISAGTSISFTDFGWCSGVDITGFQSGNPCGAGTGALTDGIIKWTSSTALPSGTQVVVWCKTALSATTGTVTGVQSTTNIPTDYMSLATGGDQIFAFQGTAASPTLITGINMNGAWDATLGRCALSPGNSTLPAALNSSNSIAITPEVDNAIYNCLVVSGSPATIRSAIFNIANWTVNDLTPFPLPLTSTFTPTVPPVTAVEYFEDETDQSKLFTNAGKSFDITSKFHITNYLGMGYGPSNQFIDNYGNCLTAPGIIGSIKPKTSGYIKVSSLWLFSSVNCETVSNDGSAIIRGKKSGATVYTITLNSANLNNVQAVDNGFKLINFSAYSAADTKEIDELEFEVSGNLRYLAIDNFSYNYVDLTQASAVTFANTTASSTDISWTNGTGTSRAVFVKAANTGTPAPVDNTIYTANTTFGSGTQLGSSGWYCVYKGTGTTANVTGLAANTAYRAMLVEYNGAAGSEKYLSSVATGNPNNITTLSGSCTLTASSASQTNIACNGGSTGSATVIASGGTPPYTYSWSPSGGTAATATGLAAGTYTVTVTDLNSCTKTQSFTITQPPVLMALAAAQTNIACNGGSTGSATVIASGGTPPYTYSWAPSGGTGATATGLSAGIYTVTVTDANSCTKTQSFTITQPPALIASAAAQTNIACNGASTGSATVIASGGMPPYTYSWAPSGGTAATATGLSAGTYTVTVTDMYGCMATKTFTLTQPPVLIASAAAQTNIACNGGSTGSATVSVTGGTPSYTYSWSPSGGTAATATGLSAGTYTVTVTDANSCTKTQSFTITQPPALIASAAAQTNVACNGGSNGSATVSVTGGTAPYSYSWSPSSGTAATATGLSAGTYTVTVTDLYGCTATRGFTITQSPAISITGVSSNSPVCAGNTITLSATASGGTSSLSYQWTGPNGFNSTWQNPSVNNASVASGGVYTVTVTDANTCSKSSSVTVSLSPVPTVNEISDQAICTNSATTAITFDGAVNGTGYNWTNNNTAIGLAANGSGNIASFTATNAGTAADTATIVVTPSVNGCTGASRSFMIIVNPLPAVDAVSDQTVCNNGSTEAISFSGNLSSTAYSWTNSNTSIGLAENGTGDIASFTATNTTNAPVTATITVTPTVGSSSGSGSGAAITPELLYYKFNGTGTSVPNLASNPPAGTTTATVMGGLSQGAGICDGSLIGSGNASSTDYLNTGWNTNLNGTSWTISFKTANITPSSTLFYAFGDANAGSFRCFTNGVAGPNNWILRGSFADVLISGGATVAPHTNTFVYDMTVGKIYAYLDGVLINIVNQTLVNISSTGTFKIGYSSNVALPEGGMLDEFAIFNRALSAAEVQALAGGCNNPVATSCSGAPQTFHITVNPTPVAIATPSSQAICSGSVITPVQLTSAVSGTSFSWTRNNTASVTGIAASGTGDISGALVNTTSAPVTVTFTITPSANGCTGTPVTATVTVNPIPTVNTISNQAICNNGATTAISFSGAVSGTTYSWTNDKASTGLAASGIGDIASFNAINTGSTPVTATIVVTPSANNCTGVSKTFTITVNPTPTVNTISNQAVCNNGTTAAISFNGAVSGTTYSWTNNNTSVGLAASGNGNIASFTAVNAGSTPVTATITVTPSANGCTGASKTFTITVNPTPAVNTVSNQTICNNSATSAISFSGAVSGTTYSWINDKPSIGLAANSNGNIASFTAINAGTTPVTATITVTPSANGCTGVSKTFTITVNPTPTVNTVSNQAVCNNGTVTAVAFTGAVSGTTYSWTNNNTSVGLAASGNGNIASFTATNTGSAPVTATITVTPSASGCTGSSKTFTITVNPTPTVNTISNQTICNNGAATAISFSGAVSGTAYSWTNDKASIGLAASGTGNIASFTATNSSNIPVTATITVTPSANGCTGSSKTFTITVNPTPTVNTINNQIICNNGATSAVSFGGAVSGTTYSWTNDKSSIGLAANGTGDIASFPAINTGSVPVTATINVTPSANGCTGFSKTFTIKVNPTPVVNTVSNQTICNNSSTDVISFSGAVSGTTYSWTNDNTSVGLAASGNGNIASFAAINTGSAPVMATITVIPSANGCTGASKTFTITVNPTPVADAVNDQTLCNNALTAAINFSGAVSGTAYSWTNDNTSVGLPASGTGDIASFTASNEGFIPATANITVIPSANSCTGLARTFVIKVNPTPTVHHTNSQVICNNGATEIISFSGDVSGTAYSWTNDNTSISLAASGNGDIASFTAMNTGSDPVTATLTVTPSANSCEGPSKTFTITVNPTPVVNTVSNQIICNNSATDAISFSGAVNGTAYSWTNDNTSVGLAANGEGDIASFTAINEGTVPVTATITVTPSANGCTGSSKTFTIVVNPTPTVHDISDQTLCNDANTAAISFSGDVSGTAFNWANNSAIGLAANGTGNIASFRAINNGSAPVTATITVTPVANSCAGSSESFTITVNPTPAVTISVSPLTTITPGQTTSILSTVSLPGGNYSWYFNDQLMSATGSQLPNRTVDGIGKYRMEYVDPNGCHNTSNEVVIGGTQTAIVYIYPNPNNGNFQVRYYNSAGEKATVNVYALSGKILFTQSFTTASPYSQVPVQLKGVVAGEIYIVEVINGAGKRISSQKIIIQK